MKRWSGTARSFAQYAGMALLGLALALIGQPELTGASEKLWRTGTAVLLAALLAAGLCWSVRRGEDGRRRIDPERLVVSLMMMGMALRVLYCYYTAADERQHDYGYWDGEAFPYGHARYIAHYASTLAPISDSFWQHHHPPLFHFIYGQLMRFLQAVTGRGAPEVMESLQLFGVGISGMILLVTRRLLGKLNIKGWPLALAMLLVCFHPTLIILSGSVNNDLLMIFFVLAAALLTLKWYENPSWSHTLLLALAIGLGMMTKLSAAVIAPVTAVFMLKQLYDAWRGQKLAPMLYKLLAFLAVCAPLGLWYVVYAWAHFGLPPGYAGSSGPSIYIGHYSVAHRFLYIPFEQFTSEYMPYCQVLPTYDNNLWMYLVKCSLFGEFQFSGAPEWLAYTMIYLNMAVILLSLAAMVYIWRKKVSASFFLVGLWSIHLVSYIAFNLKMPWICTMDYRYAVPTLITGAACIALAAQRLRLDRPKLWRGLRVPVYALCGALMLGCAAFYLVTG